MLKRVIDVILSLLGMLICLPFFPVLVLLIKLDSKGPTLYLCDRVGKDGKLFKMYKLRTMYETPVTSDSSVSPKGDPRVTPIGHILRRTKLNELPQLVNIIKGEMSFVGPRPEAPALADAYPLPARAIFSVKPGLVGPNQILGRNEEEWYPPGVDPQQYYIDEILPKKLPIDLAYVQQSSMLTDLRYLILGVKETLFKAISWNFVLQNKSQIYLLFADLSLTLLSFVISYVLRFGGVPPDTEVRILWHLLPAVFFVRLLCFVYFGLYTTLIRYFSFHDLVGVVKGVSTSSVLLVSLTFLFNFRASSRMVFFIDWLCLVVLMCSLRIALKIYRSRSIKSWEDKRKILIFGAGDAGALAYRSLMFESGPDFEVVGFLDDDPAKRYKTVYGKRVLGNRYTLEAVVSLYRVQEILLALPSASAHERAKLSQACRHAGVSYRIFPTLQDRSYDTQSRWFESFLAEILHAPDVQLDVVAAKNVIQGKRILVTGACGEFTVELCLQLLQCGPEQLIIIDRYDVFLTEIVSRLRNAFPDELVTPILFSSVCNDAIRDIFQAHRPDLVFHTATRKYRPAFDIPTEDVIRVNYLSTFELAKQAAAVACTYFVLVSSEEAAQRGNLISESLRVAEICLQQFFAATHTRLVASRLSNVLENRGSLITLLRDQVVHGEPVTLSQPDAEYPFLSKYAASHFVLQSLVLTHLNPATRGIFVCNPGSAISLREIVNRLAVMREIELESDIVNKARNSYPIAREASERGIPTSHKQIRLVVEPLYTTSSECLKAVHYLFNLRDHDLKSKAWELPTQKLLTLANPN